MLLLSFLSCLIILQIVVGKVDLASNPPEYGVDCSYPIHHGINKKECPYFWERYNEMMKKCAKMYSQSECETNEKDRLRMNLDQPKQQHNYTQIGFKHMSAPKAAWDAIVDFYNANKAQAKPEKWYRGSTIVNSWDSPSEMISFENPAFRGGFAVKQLIWDTVKPIIEEWVGRKIEPTSLYGIRVYTNGSVLATHVDRLPLVSSCIINVDQEADEPWPVEVYDHSGKAYNVTMKPGDMVLYESHTVLHGRPFPLKGKFYANIFVHFKPVDHDEMNAKDLELQNEPLFIRRRHGGSSFRALRNLLGGGSNDEDAAPPQDPSEQEIPQEITPGFQFMKAAADGDLDLLHDMLAKDPKLIHYSDQNEWQALHESIRSGKLEVVKYLIEQGADIGWKVKGGGASLWLAKQVLPKNHEVVAYLQDLGAPPA